MERKEGGIMGGVNGWKGVSHLYQPIRRRQAGLLPYQVTTPLTIQSRVPTTFFRPYISPTSLVLVFNALP